MPPMPPPGGWPPPPAPAFFFGSSATMASVVIKRAATEAAFWIAARTTLVGSTMRFMTGRGRSCNSRKFAQLCKLLLYSRQQGGKPTMHGPPNQALTYIFVVVPVDIARPGHLDPRNIGMPRLHIIG